MILKHEPIITKAVITAAASAILALLVAFAVPITEEQQAAIMGVVAVAAPLVVAAITRKSVTPNAKVVEYTPGQGVVLAGEANEHDTDAVVRMDLNEDQARLF